MGPTEVQQFCGLDEGSRTLFWAAMQQMNLSAWAYQLILKLARTIVDLTGSTWIEMAYLAEAIQVST